MSDLFDPERSQTRRRDARRTRSERTSDHRADRGGRVRRDELPGMHDADVDSHDAWDAYDDDAHEPVPRGRHAQRAERLRKKRRKARRRRAFLVLVLCLGLFGAAVFAAWTWIGPVIAGFGAPTDYTGPGTGSVDVVINPGDSGSAIGRALEEAGVVLSAGAFVDAARDEPRAGSLQPGTYTLKREMKAADALALLLDPASKISVTVQIREGLWVADVFAVISEETGFSTEQLEAAAADPAIGLPAEAGGDLEGYLFPATYTFNPDVTPVQILTEMIKRHTVAMDEAGVPAAERREVLVRASIVQNEGSRPEDLGKIATVIQNRLDRDMTLGMDSTVNFALKKKGLELTQEDLAVDSPYNTRVHKGLPPGPIGTPGQAAIEAAYQPEPGDWLFFVTVNPDTGETKFTADDAEFETFVEEYNAWRAENGG